MSTSNRLDIMIPGCGAARFSGLAAIQEYEFMARDLEAARSAYESALENYVEVLRGEGFDRQTIDELLNDPTAAPHTHYHHPDDIVAKGDAPRADITPTPAAT